MKSAVTVAAAVEGLVDEAVALRLIRHAGAEPGSVYGRSGKAQLRKQISGYNNAARHAPRMWAGASTTRSSVRVCAIA